MIKQQLVKQAYMVCGPESAGNRYVVQLLIDSGCLGVSGDVQPIDVVPSYDIAIPDSWLASDAPIVFHRSYPHNRTWPDIKTINDYCNKHGYRMTVVMIMRALEYTIYSQVNAGHVADVREARHNIARAVHLITTQTQSADVVLCMVRYEKLSDSSYTRRILKRLGIRCTNHLSKFVDGNDKYRVHNTVDVQTDA